jgi:hypothetical protein
VRGPFAATHPTLLLKARKATVSGEISRAKDPSDVYPVRVNKGERLVVSATVKGVDSLAMLNVWKPTVGDFDVSNEAGKQRIVSTGGFAKDPRLAIRVTRTGTYYVSIEAADAVEEDDPQAAVPVSEPYELLLTKQKVITKKKATSKKRAKRATPGRVALRRR